MSEELKSIFVSVASYRDPVCSTTLRSLFSQADRPELLYVGIVQQNNHDLDEDCIDDLFMENPEFYKNHCRIKRIPHTEAKGPCYARYLASKLWKGEDYYFQIDSHTKFVEGWDTKAKEMIYQIKYAGISSKPALSHYPDSIEKYNKKSSSVRPKICSAFLNERGMLSYNGSHTIDSNNEIELTRHFAAGFFFAPSEFLKEVPYDPDLDYIFVGEEITHAARLYTHGWDLFVPSQNLAFHEYTREDKPKIWSDKIYNDQKAFERIKAMLSLKEDNKYEKEEHYGLGNVRSLDQFYEEIGFDKESGFVTVDYCLDSGINPIERDKMMRYYFIKKAVKYVGIIFSVLTIVLIMVFILFPTQFKF